MIKKNKSKKDYLISKKVYEYLVRLFVKELSKDKIKLIPIFNLRSYLFDEKDKLNFKDKLDLKVLI